MDLVVFTQIYLLWNSSLCIFLSFTVLGLSLSFSTISLSFYSLFECLLVFVSVCCWSWSLCVLASVMCDGFGGFHTDILVME